MNKLSKRVNDFIYFAIQHKVMRLLKRKTDEELKDLYRQFAPLYYTDDVPDFFYRILGAVVVYCVGTTLKDRHPTNTRLQEWDFTKPYNL